MTARKYFYLLVLSLNLLFLLSPVTRAQETSPADKPIKDIIIIGNNHTKEKVIRRELLVKVGTVPTPEQLSESQRRLLNLYLFNRVELTLVPMDEIYNVLIVEVTERIYFYPVPILEINEQDWGKISYGLGLVHANFRGQNEKLWTGFWLGYRPGFSFNYYDSWVADSLHLATGFGTSRYIFNHRTLGIEEHHWVNEISIGKWWSLYFLSELALNFENIKVNQAYAHLMHSGKSVENQVGIQLSFRHDTRDLYYYPSKGWFNRVVLNQNGLFQVHDQYEQLTIDTRNYLSLGPLILAWRYYQTYLFGEVPIYRLNYIGFNERIRGHFYTEREGRNVNIGSMEIRFPILPIVYYSYSLPPIPAEYLKNLKLGLSGCLFIDSGIIWNTAPQYSFSNFDTGFGFGLHIHLPYVEVLRLDYGFNRKFRGQFIVEIGVAY
jgi:outer membrane protein insertion porin family